MNYFILQKSFIKGLKRLIRLTVTTAAIIEIHEAFHVAANPAQPKGLTLISVVKLLILYRLYQILA